MPEQLHAAVPAWKARVLHGRSGANKYRQAFHMRGLREHVQQAGAFHAVAFLREDAGVAGERAGVAGDVHDARGRVFCVQRFA